MLWCTGGVQQCLAAHLNWAIAPTPGAMATGKVPAVPRGRTVRLGTPPLTAPLRATSPLLAHAAPPVSQWCVNTRFACRAPPRSDPVFMEMFCTRPTSSKRLPESRSSALRGYWQIALTHQQFWRAARAALT